MPDGMLRLGGTGRFVGTELPVFFHTCKSPSEWTDTLPSVREDTQSAKTYGQLWAEVAQGDSAASETQTILSGAG